MRHGCWSVSNAGLDRRRTVDARPVKICKAACMSAHAAALLIGKIDKAAARAIRQAAITYASSREARAAM
jgi:hypothetical protein